MGVKKWDVFQYGVMKKGGKVISVGTKPKKYFVEMNKKQIKKFFKGVNIWQINNT